MGRPLEFDINDALNDALKQFWKEGYEATTIAKLEEAMKINRGSLYSVFRGKEPLFLQAVNLYDSILTKHVEKTLGSIDDPVEAIGSFLLKKPTQLRNRFGCFLVNSASEVVHTQPHLSKVVKAKLSAVETALGERVKEAADKDMISDEISPVDLADFFMTLRSGISIEDRLGRNHSALPRILDMIFLAPD